MEIIVTNKFDSLAEADGIIESLLGGKTVNVVGAGPNILKAISLVEILKRNTEQQIEQSNRVFEEDGVAHISIEIHIK